MNYTCNVCKKAFNSEQELRDHQQTAHPTGGRKEGGQGGEREERKDDRIAS
jgi:hypothetical protein